MTFDTDLKALDVPEHRPGFFDDLREELGRGTTRTTHPRLLLAAAAAAIVAGALTFGLTRGSEVASAAQVRAAVERALASTGSISGVFVNDGSVRWRFVASSTGAFRIEGLTSPSVRVYDPATNVETTSDGSLFVRRTDLAPGPPDSGPANFVIQRGLGSVVADLAAAGDPKVAEVTYDGRPAWLLTTPDRLVTVDLRTGIPVRDERLRDGKVTSEWQIEGLRVSSTAPAIEPLEPRPGQESPTYSAGFQSLLARKTPAIKQPLFDGELTPRHLPAGFKLYAVAFAWNSRPTGEEDGGNPPSSDVFSFAYRRGFDEIIVTTRRTGASPADWSDPLQVSTVTSSQPEHVTFTGGTLAGQTGWFVLEPDALPHVWTVGPELVVTVAGTVDRADLLKVANSLHVAAL